MGKTVPKPALQVFLEFPVYSDNEFWYKEAIHHQDKGSMKKNVDFGKLVKNAFNFLDKARREFESELRYAVIHFYAALELFLKARLLHEH